VALAYIASAASSGRAAQLDKALAALAAAAAAVPPGALGQVRGKVQLVGCSTVGGGMVAGSAVGGSATCMQALGWAVCSCCARVCECWKRRRLGWITLL
jgi:hypothetical protein